MRARVRACVCACVCVCVCVCVCSRLRSSLKFSRLLALEAPPFFMPTVGGSGPLDRDSGLPDLLSTVPPVVDCWDIGEAAQELIEVLCTLDVSAAAVAQVLRSPEIVAWIASWAADSEQSSAGRAADLEQSSAAGEEALPPPPAPPPHRGKPCMRRGCTRWAFFRHRFCCRYCRQHTQEGAILHTRYCNQRQAEWAGQA